MTGLMAGECQPDAVILRVELAVKRNAAAVRDRRDKELNCGRIDGVVALAMALGAAEASQAAGAVSTWDCAESWK